MSLTRTPAGGGEAQASHVPPAQGRGSRSTRERGKRARSRHASRRAGGDRADSAGSSWLDGDERAARNRLLMVCGAVVVLGLLTVLLVNSVLSQGAFRQHELEIQLILLSEKEEALARAVQVDEAPLTIEKRAVALGMVPAAAPVFLNLKEGKVQGEPVPAPTPTAPVVVAPDELTAPGERLSSSLAVPLADPSAVGVTGPAGATPAQPGAGALGSGTPAPGANGQGAPAPTAPAPSASAAPSVTATPAAPAAPTGATR